MLDGADVALDITINPVDAYSLALGAVLPYRLIEDPSVEPGTFRAAALAGELTLSVAFLEEYKDMNPRALIVSLCEEGFTGADPFYCHEWRAGFRSAARRDRL